MSVIGTALDARSPQARANADTTRALVQDLRATAERVRVGGAELASFVEAAS